jgi:BirA family biotin operon repressor/biotin-[acetyl-CoA-carboxylase] ligase
MGPGSLGTGLLAPGPMGPHGPAESAIPRTDSGGGKTPPCPRLQRLPGSPTVPPRPAGSAALLTLASGAVLRADAAWKARQSRSPQPGDGSPPGNAPGTTTGSATPSTTASAIPSARPARGAAWRLRALPVCASTELELDRWLETLAPDPTDPLPTPLAVIARRQRHGHGQQGRPWLSPAGGVWLSAALPWPADPAMAAAPGLAVAVGLALELEALGLTPRLKWPNDLLIAGPRGRPAKVAGMLPRLRLRGSAIRWARVGVGLNGCNRVPAGATNLKRELGPCQARPKRLAARVLRALEWAMAMADQPQAVRAMAEQRLLVSPGSWDGAAEGWQPFGLADDGALVLARGEERRLLRRRFD